MADNHLCLQEPRLIKLEAAIERLSTILTDIRELLAASVRADERIAALRTESQDREKRLRKLEDAQAGARWLERAAWMLLAAATTFLLTQGVTIK
jgi:uncharacterized protein involved in exopolysaccharide biosynthesis